MDKLPSETEENTVKTALLSSSVNKVCGLGRKLHQMKFILGVTALILVDIIWVASSQLTRFLFKDVDFDKPYMSTYVKISMFSVYLIGFIFYPPWRRQCIRCACDDYPGQYQLVGETDTEDTDDGEYAVTHSLSESIYVPAKIPSGSEMESCSDGEKQLNSSKSRVKFNNLMEVKHLQDCDDAQIARMNYGAALRAKSMKRSAAGKLSLTRVIRISLFFTVVFFMGNLAYQEALSVEEVAVVNVFSSTSGMFTLILAAMFPSGPTDKFTITKLVAVLMSFTGIVAVCVASSDVGGSTLLSSDSLTTGALWAVLGSFCYALYLVFFKKAVGDNNRVDVPMFFGFVGLFCFSLLWPGLVVFHYINFEAFELPSKLPALLMVVNGLVGTVLSELLWMWGCLATSSIMGTLSLSLTIPLSILTDIVFRNAHYPWLFYVGTAQVFMSFVIVTYLSSNRPTRDPILRCVKQSCCCCCANKKTDLDRSQEIPLKQMEEDT